MAIQWGAGTSYRAAKARLTEGKIIEPLRLNLGEGSYYERLRTSLEQSVDGSLSTPNAFLRRSGDPIPVQENPQAAALSMLGIDLNDVLGGVGIRIGQELANKWSSVEDDEQFWTHLTEEWRELGMGEIVTKGMPP